MYLRLDDLPVRKCNGKLHQRHLLPAAPFGAGGGWGVELTVEAQHTGVDAVAGVPPVTARREDAAAAIQRVVYVGEDLGPRTRGFIDGDLAVVVSVEESAAFSPARAVAMEGFRYAQGAKCVRRLCASV